MRSWIQSLEGRRLEPLNLQPDQVGSIEEIAHSLAGKFRFTCQTALRYSVAEHCVRGSSLLPAAFAGAFLLHELSEVYSPDISAPVKPSVWVEAAARRPVDPAQIQVFAERREGVNYGSVTLEIHPGETPEDAARAYLGLVQWSELERQQTRVILTALGLSSIEPLIYSPEVKAMDLAMLMVEKRDLCGPEPESWGIDAAPANTGQIKPWDPIRAAAEFTDRYRELFQAGQVVPIESVTPAAAAVRWCRMCGRDQETCDHFVGAGTL